jgi:hypothetical protein
LLGARSWIAAERAKGGSPLVVIPGNNQAANFTFLREQVLLPNANYLSLQQPPGLSREAQAQRQILRFWYEMGALQADAIGLSAEDFVRSLRDPREERGAGVRDRGSILHRWLRQVTDQGRGIPVIGSNAIVTTSARHLNVIKHGAFALAGIDERRSADWMTTIEVAHPKRPNIEFSLWDAGQRLQTIVTTGDASSSTFDSGEGALLPGHRYEVKVRDGRDAFSLAFHTHLALTPRQNEPYSALNGYPIVAKTLADGSPLLILSLVDPGVKRVLGNDPWTWQHNCPQDECEIGFMAPADAVRDGGQGLDAGELLGQIRVARRSSRRIGRRDSRSGVDVAARALHVSAIRRGMHGVLAAMA